MAIDSWRLKIHVSVETGLLKPDRILRDFSLRTRLLITATLTLVGFLSLAGLALDRAFISSTSVSMQSELRAQVYALLSVMEVADSGEVFIPAQLPNSRLGAPDSRFYALVLNADSSVGWRSASALGMALINRSPTPPGEDWYQHRSHDGYDMFEYRFGISWETESGTTIPFVLVVVDASQNYARIIDSHRITLVFWLGLAGAFLLVVQALVLHWGFAPLPKVVKELDRIEHLGDGKIQGKYPGEIAQLSNRINRFIDNERDNKTRYRNVLDNLAHSLKTPLAVIKTSIAKDHDKHDVIHDHVDQMNRIIEYQLNRASVRQVNSLTAGVAVNVNDVIQRIVGSLQKVYAQKNIVVKWDLEQSAVFYGEPRDLYELLGNLLDNAFKWAVSEVSCHTESCAMGEGVLICLEDDGPGIPKHQRKAVLQRGIRGDEKQPGQGIGLAASMEIIEMYQGRMTILDQRDSGTKIEIQFPGREVI